MKKLSELLTKDLGWKFVSLLIAIGLWFFVVNEINPVKTIPFSTTLKIMNIDEIKTNNYILVNEYELSNTKISMQVRASYSDLDFLTKNSNTLKAYIDLKPIDFSRSSKTGEPQPITVYYEIGGGLIQGHYEVTLITPPTVNIVLDKYITKQLPVSVNRVGEAKAGFVSLQPAISPDKVSVSGPKMIIDTIESVSAQIDLTNVSKDVEVQKKLLVLNNLGDDITSKVTLDKKEATVSVPVNKYAKIPISTPTLTGRLPEGYHIAWVSLTPEFVEVVGDAADIASVKSIQLEPINIDNFSTNKKISINLKSYLLDTKLAIKNNTPQEAIVDIVIEKEVRKNITMPLENLLIKGSLSYELLSKEIKLEVEGGEEVIKKLETSKITGSIDLTNATAGVQRAKVEFSLPEGIIQVGEPTVIDVEVLDNSANDPDDVGSTDDPNSTEQSTNETAEPTGTPVPSDDY